MPKLPIFELKYYYREYAEYQKQNKVTAQPMPIPFIIGVIKLEYAALKRQLVRLFASEKALGWVDI